jgi:chromosome segregation ATPase
LEESKKELQVSQDEYKTLKERAKNVASELKERRAECRTLSSEVEILKANNANLQERITQLEAMGMDMNQSSQEIQEEMDTLRACLKEKEKQIVDVQASIAIERTKGEEALASYKKKAQQSLALANSRAASAVQSREEAELEARAARTTADSAMQRAITAESKGKQALAEAKQYVDDMEKEVAKYTDVMVALEKASKELVEVRSEKQHFQDSNEQLKCELTSIAGRLEAEQATNSDLKQSLSEAQNRSNELYDEVERLRRDGKRLQEDVRRLSETGKPETATEQKVSVIPERNAEAEATIAMLQQELKDANHAIKDLKETLKATMDEKEQEGDSGVGGGGTHHYNSNGRINGNGGADAGMPLFYAMEKQAELTLARDEIARLANLLGDAESSKQEAVDSAQEMRRLMEDAQARLKRQEQLKQNPEQESVNLEYLKNIMLSYLNAKTVMEKKALLPVIGTVLCLTPEEQLKAMEGLDKGNTSMMDNVASGVLKFGWS